MRPPDQRQRVAVRPTTMCDAPAVTAERGFAVPDSPGMPLRTLQDVFAYAQAGYLAAHPTSGHLLTAIRITHIMS
jgi:hypothetical protein